MPIGLVRLNERRQRPNQNITFIKTSDGPDADVEQDILERVAAIVWPIMKSHGLGVMSLESFPPNREFWGRNFNAGECIQLVLKSPTNGRWLPFPFICKVMIHELAHVKHMNHSKAFQTVRIGFQKELDALVARGYSGEGFWSRGKRLSSDYTGNRVVDDTELPDNLCGGTYRRANKAGTKRKLTYAEQKNRRKEKLFGKSEGDSLGASEKERLALEKGKGKTSKASSVKPRVAQSQRGRDLRAEAAQKRAEAQQKEASTSKAKKKESDDEEDYTTDEEDTVDVGGGNRLVKVEDGGNDEEDWQEMQDEMKLLCATTTGGTIGASTSASTSGSKPNGKQKKPLFNKDDSSATEDSDLEVVAGPSKKEAVSSPRKSSPTLSSFIVKKQTSATPPRAKTSTSRVPKAKQDTPEEEEGDTPPPPSRKPVVALRPSAPSRLTCQACTTENSPGNPLCQVCANVLDRSRTPNWKCTSSSCAGGIYANPMDAGVCGCCGSRKM